MRAGEFGFFGVVVGGRVEVRPASIESVGCMYGGGGGICLCL